MTLIFLGNERRHRKKRSSSKTSKPQPVAQTAHGFQSTAHIQPQNYPPPKPEHPSTAYTNNGYSLAAPQHPIYGAMPQPYGSPQQHYGSPPLQPMQPLPYGSTPLQPVQPCINNSTISFAASHSSKRQEGKFQSSWDKMDRIAAKSYNDLKETLTSGAGKSATQLNSPCKMSTQALNQGAALCDLISSKLNAVITSIDEERFSGREQDLLMYPDSEGYPSTSTVRTDASRALRPNPVYPSSKGGRGSNHFSKAWLYANSRLPPYLPPFKLYLPAYPLLCLAANYSERVYTPPAPRSSEKESHIPSDWRSGTKAMVLKSIPVDDMNTIVFAIRGSQTFMDWAVNFRQAPSSPAGFLDDEGNLCHSGFLQVARQMIAPVAERLRTLLQENPGRSSCSLLITGHSAGGAVAALLYAHMLSSNVKSDLTYLTGFFKRVHCITFGAPPISLLPLQKPNHRRHMKSLFFAFINEGDPVPRADKQVVLSLLKLYASPAPTSSCASTLSALSHASASSLQTASSRPSKFSKVLTNTNSTSSSLPVWNIPSSTLSTAGRLVVLRHRPAGRGEDDIEAITVDEDLLRTIMYGDPLKHMMSLYKRRVECLATQAVTAKGY
ncbi:alpha/beta-hydrolase [Lojkania enalia]|uniref:Alpha/beta-hydrolase n=1 Tax=Lojkania enalia TaxID=147567 RepID=A0A9P4NBK0_9PLEO|nr:alpha/beta-hydrolase [Didymosphaeria enalia]